MIHGPTLVGFLRRLVYYRTVLKTSEIEHPYTAISPTANEDIDAIRTKPYVEDLFVVGYELCLGG